MAEKIAWVFFGTSIVCIVGGAFISPFYSLETASICCAAAAIILGVFGFYFAFSSWRE